MSLIAVTAFLLAPVTDPEILRQLNAPPPCPKGAAECEPWEREWWQSDPVVEPNPFDKFDPKPPTGPAYLVIATPQAIRTIPYKTMAACERARRYAAGPPAGSPTPNGGVYGPPLVTYTCVPR